jgi:mannose-1-phosphate guanylyltransferase
MTSISGAIIDNSTKIGHKCVLETGTVIGPRVVLRDHVTIHSNVKLWPEVVIEKDSDISETQENPQYS